MQRNPARPWGHMCTAVVLIGWSRGPPVPRQPCAVDAVQGQPAGGQLAPLRHLPVAVALQPALAEVAQKQSEITTARRCHGRQRGCGGAPSLLCRLDAGGLRPRGTQGDGGRWEGAVGRGLGSAGTTAKVRSSCSYRHPS
jgi:hypothetical protein